MPVRLAFEKIAIFAAGAFFATAIGYVYPVYFRPDPSQDICSTRLRKTVSDLWGVDFHFVETPRDLFAHSRQARVYIARHGARQRNLIFAYEPADERWGPNFQIDYQGAVALYLRGVNAVYFEDHNWGDATIDYWICAAPTLQSEMPTPRWETDFNLIDTKTLSRHRCVDATVPN